MRAVTCRQSPARVVAVGRIAKCRIAAESKIRKVKHIVTVEASHCATEVGGMSIFNVARAPAPSVMSSPNTPPISKVATPSISAEPVPLTLPSIVILPPFAHSSPELAISLWIARPPLPVAPSVPELMTTFAPVSIVSALVPLAIMVPLLWSVSCPAELAGAGDCNTDVGYRHPGRPRRCR